MDTNHFISSRDFHLDEFGPWTADRFLQAAYAALLKREPDPQGYEHYLQQLLTGGITRAEVLGRLRYSAEGRRHKVRIRGLLRPFVLDSACSLPLAGQIFSFMQVLLKLPRLQRQLRSLQETHGQDLSSLKALGDKHDQSLEHMEPELYRLALVTERDRERDIPEAVYLALENEFRGEQQDLQLKLEKYLPFIQAVLPLGGRVLDLGSGRGEWLGLLSSQGIPAQGVDLSQSMVMHCQQQGLQVICADALDHLSSLEAESLSAITAFHLMEHLPPPVLVRLWQEAFRVLKPGGLVLFETPNPENVQVSTYFFYLDPTHHKPLPPPLATHTMYALGFRDMKVIRNSEFTEPIFEDPRLNSFFCAAMDYAVVGYKTG